MITKQMLKKQFLDENLDLNVVTLNVVLKECENGRTNYGYFSLLHAHGPCGEATVSVYDSLSEALGAYDDLH